MKVSVQLLLNLLMKTSLFGIMVYLILFVKFISKNSIENTHMIKLNNKLKNLLSTKFSINLKIYILIILI